MDGMFSQDDARTTGPATAARRLAGLWLELRVIPVLLWSTAAVTLGTAVGWNAGSGLGWWAAAALIGALLQGVVAHTVNEVADWRSGTDGHPAPRLLSGGSKVVRAGLLSERELVVFGWTAGVVATGTGIWIASQRGWSLLALGGLGLVGAVAYTAAPIRLAYRPVAGELVAFTCVLACVVGGEVVQRGAASFAAVLVGATHGAYCVSMLLLHHDLDRDPDASARPQKRTSVVAFGRHAKPYSVAWAGAAAALAVTVAIVVHPALWLLVAASLVGVVGQLTVARGDPVSVTRIEAIVIGAGIAAAFGAAAIMEPTLAWLIVVPALLTPMDLAVTHRVLVPRLQVLQDSAQAPSIPAAPG